MNKQKLMDFATWKAEYSPRIYEDSGAECYDHEECDCEFLYSFEPSELQELQEEEGIKHKQVWTWHNDGRISSGISGTDLLVTEKPWTEEMEII